MEIFSVNLSCYLSRYLFPEVTREGEGVIRIHDQNCPV